MFLGNVMIVYIHETHNFPRVDAVVKNVLHIEKTNILITIIKPMRVKDAVRGRFDTLG